MEENGIETKKDGRRKRTRNADDGRETKWSDEGKRQRYINERGISHRASISLGYHLFFFWPTRHSSQVAFDLHPGIPIRPF